jgi:hypothetical protein
MKLATPCWGSLGLAFIISAGIACGSSSKGSNGGGTFTTSVPASTKLTDLTPGQATQLCNDLGTYEQTTALSASCKLAGLLQAELLLVFSDSPPPDAELQQACAQGYNACLNPDGGATTSTSTCTASDLMGQPSTCQATVADLQTCITDINATYAALPSCSSLTAASVASWSQADGGTGSSSEPASCAKFDATCNSPG